MRAPVPRLVAAPLVAFTWLTLSAPLAQAQSAVQRDLRASQLRLDSIRQERERLQREMASLQSRVRDASRDLVNVGRQRAASASALQELEFQTAILQTNVEQTSTDLEATKQALADRTEALRSRLRAIYKRGSLHTVRVLLSAESFGDLLTRYKYLQRMAQYDRIVLDDVRSMQADLASQQEELQLALAQLERLRDEKGAELARLQRLEQQGRRALSDVRRAESRTADQIEAAARDESRLVGIIERLERDRIEEERRRASGGEAAAAATISTRDLGTLGWPVDGQVIYRFGPDRKPNGITLINNGIGIAAASGTPVRAVEGGMVSHAGPFEGYGSMVMLNHGGGFYTLYMYLRSVTVREGQPVTSGQVIGLVGGEQTPEGPHLEFQVRAPLRGTMPEPVDPLTWLRSRTSR
ncbi:MAG: peptidoglycan DD-metalloendopeptidase family protein [Gemmatimonadetes bacterium]|nr:peptidoglycan DD-metalloendopeptidase family protein [Gemmatimonadota bacterium]